MKVRGACIPDVHIVEPVRHTDARGFLSEIYHRRRLADEGIRFDAVQANHSRSARGVLRGLHFQTPPAGQAKIVQVVHGTVFDAVVDLREGSPTHGKWVGVELSGENGLQLYVPPGFAHGFCALSERADVVYLLDGHYAPEHEGGLRWDDPEVGIEWPLGTDEVTLSDRDRSLPGLQELGTPFPATG